MLKTINNKFIFFTIVFFLLSVGIPTTFLIIQFRDNFEQRSKIMVESTIEMVQRCVMNAMRLGTQKHIQTIVDNISISRGVDNIRIFNEQGLVLYATDTLDIGKSMHRIAPRHIESDDLGNNSINLINEERIYSTTRPILNRPDCQSCHGSKNVVAYLDIDANLTQAERFFYTGSMHMIFLAILIVVILFFGSYFLFNHFINKPLFRFRRALDGVEKGNLDIRLPANKQDEIGILEGHFNKMTHRLKESKEKIEELHFEQLQRADKLVTLGELAAEMAHEINNPAGVIMSRADYMHLAAQEETGIKKYEQDLRVIMNQVERVSKITGNILKYSKKLPKKFHSFNLQNVVEESLHILEPRLRKNEITLIKNFKTENPEIYGDPHQLEQVIANLINNAIDAMDFSGNLTIEIKYNSLNKLQFVVTDNGKGIDPSDMEHIFTPFFTTKPGEKGTGLGLYIIKNICKNHQAEIECNSTPGQGTTFTITFSGNFTK